MHVPHTACTATDVAKPRRQQRPLCARVITCLRVPCPYLRVPFLRAGPTLACSCLAYAACVLFARIATSLLRATHYQPLARALLCSLYLLCTSCPLFSVVVITICAEILSLYPMPFLSLSSDQLSLSAITRLTHAWRGPPLRAGHASVYIRVQVYVCVSVM
jgi:hypothetical protein